MPAFSIVVDYKAKAKAKVENQLSRILFLKSNNNEGRSGDTRGRWNNSGEVMFFMFGKKEGLEKEGDCEKI